MKQRRTPLKSPNVLAFHYGRSATESAVTCGVRAHGRLRLALSTHRLSRRARELNPHQAADELLSLIRNRGDDGARLSVAAFPDTAFHEVGILHQFDFMGDLEPADAQSRCRLLFGCLKQRM